MKLFEAKHLSIIGQIMVILKLFTLPLLKFANNLCFNVSIWATWHETGSRGMSIFMTVQNPEHLQFASLNFLNFQRRNWTRPARSWKEERRPIIKINRQWMFLYFPLHSTKFNRIEVKIMRKHITQNSKWSRR